MNTFTRMKPRTTVSSLLVLLLAACTAPAGAPSEMAHAPNGGAAAPDAAAPDAGASMGGGTPGFSLADCVAHGADDMAKFEDFKLQRALANQVTVGSRKALGKYSGNPQDAQAYLADIRKAAIGWAGQVDQKTGLFADLQTSSWTGWDGAHYTKQYALPIGNDATTWQEHLFRVYFMLQSWRNGVSEDGPDQDKLLAAGKAAMEAYLAIPKDTTNLWGGYMHTWADLFESWLIGESCLFVKFESTTGKPNRIAQSDIDRWAESLPNFWQKFDLLLRSGWNMTATSRGVLASNMALGDPARRMQASCETVAHIWEGVATISPKSDAGGIDNFSVDGMLGEHSILQPAAYGNWFLGDLNDLNNVTKDWPTVRMPAASRAALIRMILGGQLYNVQGNSFDRNLGGRFPDAVGTVPSSWLTMLFGQDSETDHRVGLAQAWLDSGGKADWPFPESAFKSFYTVDFSMKHFPKTAVSWHAASDRTLGGETFDNATADVRYRAHQVLFPAGSSFIRRDGNEYPPDLMQHRFDYGRPPGVTSKHVGVSALEGVWHDVGKDGALSRFLYGGEGFSGSVEAGATGVAGFWQSVNIGSSGYAMSLPPKDPSEIKWTPLSTSGKKAVFFLDDAVVHLGAGYDTRGAGAFASAPTVTSLEQRAANAKSELAYGTQGHITTAPDGKPLSVSDASLAWAWYGGTGYLLPSTGGEKHIVLDGPLSDGSQVLSIYSDEGATNPNLSFEWAVIPEVAESQMPSYVKTWQVVANTTRLQAVRVAAKSWVGAVFHDPTAVLDAGDFTVAVDQPALLVVMQQGNTFDVRVADPRHDHDLDGLNLTVHITPKGAAARIKTIALPHDETSGKTFSLTL